MATTYCTPEDVAMFGQFLNSEGDRAVWGEDPPTPTEAEVEAFINTAEEDIEDRCRISFGTRATQWIDELHNCYPDYLETAIHLKYGNVVTLDDNENDSLKIWYNNTWTELLGGSYTEARDGHYYVDYKLGKIYFYRIRPLRGANVVRVTYRTNFSSTVPERIREATALIAAKKIIGSPAFTIYFPEGEGRDTVGARLSRWTLEISRAIKRYRVEAVTQDRSFVPVRYG
jgi:hypothetical protein